MSYDLFFWKYQNGGTAVDNEVYKKLSDGQAVSGLEDLPINEILQSIENKFTTDSWKKVDKLTYEGDVGAFQIYTTSQCFCFNCYGMTGDKMNLLIEIGLEFGCPLYDPQTSERFDSK